MSRSRSSLLKKQAHNLQGLISQGDIDLLNCDPAAQLWLNVLLHGILGAYKGKADDLDWVITPDPEQIVGSMEWICDHLSIDYEPLRQKVIEGLQGEREIANPNSPNISRALNDRPNGVTEHTSRAPGKRDRLALGKHRKLFRIVRKFNYDGSS